MISQNVCTASRIQGHRETDEHGNKSGSGVDCSRTKRQELIQLLPETGFEDRSQRIGYEGGQTIEPLCHGGKARSRRRSKMSD
jgi:hypothetical protein